jgi:hypothetical protein
MWRQQIGERRVPSGEAKGTPAPKPAVAAV